MSPALAGGFFTAEPPGKPVGELTLLLAGSSARTNSQGPHSSPQGPLHRLLRLPHSVSPRMPVPRDRRSSPVLGNCGITHFCHCSGSQFITGPRFKEKDLDALSMVGTSKNLGSMF